MTRDASTPVRLEYLDALRGLAILGVLLVHTSQLVPGADLLALQIFAAGKLGVQLFFVVSAFTLWSALRLHPADDAPGVAAFFVRRAFRILPAYWSGIVAWVGLYALGPGGVRWAWVALAATFTSCASPDAINYIPPGGWSVTDEVAFYLLVPLAARWLTSIRRATAALVVSAAVAAILPTLFLREDVRAWLVRLGASDAAVHGARWSRSWFLYFWFPTQLPVFLTGVLAYRISERWRSPPRVAGLALIVVALEGIGFVALSRERMLGLRHVLISLCFGALLLGLRTVPLAVFVNPVTRRLGRVSFSMYLIHYAFRLAFDVVLGTRLHALFGAEGVLAIVGIFAAVTIASWACAEVAFRFVERPGIALGARVSRDLVDRRHARRYARRRGRLD